MNFYEYLFAHLMVFATKAGTRNIGESAKIYMDLILLMVLSGPIFITVALLTHSLIIALGMMVALMIGTSVFNKRYLYRNKRYDKILEQLNNESPGKRRVGAIIATLLLFISFTLPFLSVYLIVALLGISHLEI